MRGDVDYFNVTSLVTAANTGTALKVLPQPQSKSDVWPLVQDRVLYAGGFQLSQQRRAWRDPNVWSRSQPTIPTPIRLSLESPP